MEGLLDLLQDDTERDNTFHTWYSGAESYLLPSESRAYLLLYPIYDNFAQNFENNAQ